MKKLLSDYTLEEVENIITEKGFPKFRAKQLYDWVKRGAEFSEITNLPKAFIEAISFDYEITALSIIKTLTSNDGTKKFLYALHDGNVIEGVLMSYSYGKTLCVSTQVGCRMGCAFCASGIGGLVRNLSAGEILGQIIAVNKEEGGGREITNVVLMGSGEPLDNYDNVTKFITLANKELGISQRNISLSTSGIVPKIIELSKDYSVTLTISLHATCDEVREKLMPIDKKYKLEELIGAAKTYFENTGRRVVFEYSMIDKVNDTDEDVERLAALMRGFPSHVNLIRLNTVKEKGLKGTPIERVKEFMNELTKRNVSVTLRRSMGNDIEGACGQLRRKFIGDKGE